MSETEKGTEQSGGAAVTSSAARTSNCGCLGADVALRVLLLAASIVSVVLMVTSKQTETIAVPNLPGFTITRSAKFDHSPAFIFFVAALSLAGLYSIITAIASMAFMGRSNVPVKYFLVLAVHDLIIMGIVAAATGTAGGVAYIGLKGNTHVNWGKICGVYDKFCRFIGSSIAVSLFASVLLLLLVVINVFTLYCRIPGRQPLFGAINF